MSSENALLELLGPARHQTYMDAAAGTPQRAAELYEWSNKLAGAWHSHIAYVEVAVRNAIDRQLRTWNASQVRLRRLDSRQRHRGRDLHHHRQEHL